MNVGTFRIEVRRASADGKMVQFTCEFEGATTKQELDRFMTALNDGHFFFKKTDELGNGKEWKE